MIRKQADDDHPDADAGRAPVADPATPQKSDAPRADTDETALQRVGKVVAQLVVAVAIVAAGLGLTYLLVQTKTAPAKLTAVRAAPVVVVAQVENATADATVRGFGSVRAATELRIVPQVGGRVTSVHPQLVAGGTIPAGAVVLEIDPTDYELALERARADLQRAKAALTRVDASRRAASAEVVRAETALATTRAEAQVAREEFERLRPNEPVPPLVAKEPQQRQAESAVAAAKAQLEAVNAEELELQAQQRQAEAAVRQAEVNLGRAKVTLPEEPDVASFRVLEESVNVGQFVTAGSPLATVYAADSLEVPVPLEDRQLRWINLRTEGEASPATITLDYAGEQQTWPAFVDRTAGQIDPRTRLVEVVVKAEQAESEPGGVRLVPGLFVNVAIDGQPLDRVAAVPRRALHTTEEGQTVVYAAVPNDAEGSDATLASRPVEIIRRSGDMVYVRGLEDGDLVVLTRLDVIGEGMAVRVGQVQEAAQ